MGELVDFSPKGNEIRVRVVEIVLWQRRRRSVQLKVFGEATALVAHYPPRAADLLPCRDHSAKTDFFIGTVVQPRKRVNRFSGVFQSTNGLLAVNDALSLLLSLKLISLLTCAMECDEHATECNHHAREGDSFSPGWPASPQQPSSLRIVFRHVSHRRRNRIDRICPVLRIGAAVRPERCGSGVERSEIACDAVGALEPCREGRTMARRGGRGPQTAVASTYRSG